jgi:glycosyltransferase involved in cell wall biosynthesis
VKRLRVLFLIDKAVDNGGAERFAVGLATHLPRDRFKVWMCSTREADPPVLRALAEADVTHVHLGRRAKWDVHRFAPLVSLLRRERIDMLHAHMFGSNLWGTLIGRACRVPILLAHEQTWSYQGEPLRRWTDGHVIGRIATRFVAVSTADARRMVTIEGVPAEKVVMIPNAYVPRPGAPNGNLRDELGIDELTPLTTVVSVLRPQKALWVLLEAHARVLDAIPDAHLAIAGDGPCREFLERRAGELGLDGHVHFLGYRRDIDSILRATDVAAMSSDYEGTPLVAFECMANRTPLVATAVGGLPDIVENGRTGLLVAPREPGALADALISLLEDRALGEQLAAAAADRAGEFTIEAIAARFVALYELLASEAS